MELLFPLLIFIVPILPSLLFAGTTIRFNFRGNQLFQKKLPPGVKPFFILPSSSSSSSFPSRTLSSSSPLAPPSPSSSSSLDSSLPSILLASTLASTMMTDAMMIRKEMQATSNANRRDSGIVENLKSGIGSAVDNIGSRLDIKSGLNNVFDKFQPFWGRQPTFGSMLSDITNTKDNEQKSFKLPASIAEKLGTSSITTSGSSSSYEPSSSGSSRVSKWVNPFVNYPVAKSQPATRAPVAAPPQPTPAPSTNIHHQVVMPFGTTSGQSWPPSGHQPYPYASQYPGYSGYRSPGMAPGMSASHPYAVVVPPPQTTTTPAPAPKTPRTIVIEEEDDEDGSEGDGSGKGGEISIGGIQTKQVLKLLGGVAASTGVNLGSVMQTVINTAVTSVAAGLAAATKQVNAANNNGQFNPNIPMAAYGQQQQFGQQNTMQQQQFQQQNSMQQQQFVQQNQMQQQQFQQSQQQPFQQSQQQVQQSQPQQQSSGQASKDDRESDPLNNNPKSKDEIIDDGDEEVIVIRRPKLKASKQSASSQTSPASQASVPNQPVQQAPVYNPMMDQSQSASAQSMLVPPLLGQTSMTQPMYQQPMYQQHTYPQQSQPMYQQQPQPMYQQSQQQPMYQQPQPQPTLPQQQTNPSVASSFASQFQSLLSSASQSSSGSPLLSLNQGSTSPSASGSPPVAPFIKIGESKISFKPTNEGLSISFGKD